MSKNDKTNGMVNCTGTAKFYPGSRLPEVITEEMTEPKQHITRTQTLKWHDARKDIPEMNRVCLIKVPDSPWNFDGKGDIKQDVVYLESCQVFNEGELPYVFSQFGPGTYDYNEVTEWAYLDE